MVSGAGLTCSDKHQSNMASGMTGGKVNGFLSTCLHGALDQTETPLGTNLLPNINNRRGVDYLIVNDM